MIDLILETARSLVLAALLVSLLQVGRQYGLERQRGWSFIIAGFGLILLGSLFDITDNFDSLSRYVVIGDTEVQAVLEKVVGYLFGFVLLFHGFRHWLPILGARKKDEIEVGVSKHLPMALILIAGIVISTSGFLMSKRYLEDEQVTHRLDEFQSEYTSLMPWTVAALGLLLTLMLVQYIVATDRRTQIVARLVKERTQELTITNEALEVEMSERVRIEKQLRESENRFRAFLNNSPAAVFIKDLSGRYTFLNQAFRDWYCPNGADPVGQTACEVFPEALAKFYVDQDQEVLQSLEAIEREHEILFADGSEHVVRITKFPIKDVSGQTVGVGTINIDITNQRRAERQLHQTQRIDAIGQLAGGIAHDLNNMLVPILGLTQLTIGQLPPESQASKNLDNVLQASSRAKQLVDQILSFSRSDDIERAPVDFRTIAEEVLALMQSTLPENTEILRRLCPEACMILASSTQIHQVVMNLVSNALDAMIETGGVLDVALAAVDVDARRAEEVPGLSRGRYARLTVKDEGCGMDDPTRERIFEPFFTTKPVGKGTGMGLSVVHGIVSQQSGAITVSSAVGKGTSIEVYFPLWCEATAGDAVAGHIALSHRENTSPEKSPANT